MRSERLRGWWPMGVVAGIVVAAALLLYQVWRSPHRNDLATYGAFAVAVVAVVASWAPWAWKKAQNSTADSAADSKSLNRAADQLAHKVQAQWKKAAGERRLTGADPIQVTWGRPSLPLAGPSLPAVGSRRFKPLPGLEPAGEAQLEAGQISDLHALYGGLGSGRLIIAGPPGSGKSGAAVRLILAALEHREQLSDQEKRKVPVPILVTAQDWDPDPQPVADWLVRQLQETYTLFARAAGATTAAAMIATGKIAMILDGLDEMAADLRSVALEALDEQAAFRIVILSRTAEMASAASRHVLQGAAAIELRPVNPAEAASYLERIQLDRPLEGWRNLIERIRTGPASPLRKALDNPLTLTLVRDTYLPGDDVRELLEFSDTALHGVPADQAVEAITDHLLGRLLPTAYAHRPGQAPLPYDLPTAQNALTKIAARMNQDGTRDLQWWQLPAWTRAPQRAVMAGLVTGLVTWLVAGLWFAQGKEIEFVVLGGLVGVVTAIPKELMGFGGNQPRSISKLRPRKALSRSLFVGAGIGAGIGAVLGLSLTVNSLATKLVVALALGLAFGLAGGLVTGLAAGLTADPDSNSSLSPANSWRNDQEYGLVLGILTGLVTGLVTWLVTGLAFALSVGLIVGLWYGLKSSEAWPVSLTAVQLAIKWHTPVRLMKFLNDAHHRDILRIVGPTYQFRHARLQDRLAAEAGNGDGNVASDRAKANSL